MEKNKDGLKNVYAVIMAGGTGTRLWPISRKEKPKQFQKLTSSRTMIQETYDRVKNVVPEKNIMVSTSEQYKDLVISQLPELSTGQLIIEPMPRGTAPAISLVAKHLYYMNPEAIVATISSDHAIKNVDEFVSSISCAIGTTMNHKEKLVTIGINPTHPDTSLGYIKMGKEFSNSNERRVFYVESFVEKPDKKEAEKFVAGWEYLWNAGYFIFSAKNFLDVVKELKPEIYEGLEEIGKCWESGVIDAQKIAEIYKKMPNEPVEPVIISKMSQENRLVIPSELQWSDVGNWGTLFDFFKDSFDSSLIVKGNNIDEGSRDCLIYTNDKLIATLGLKDIVIVETDDAILVANKNSVNDVKKIIEKLKEQGKHLYL